MRLSTRQLLIQSNVGAIAVAILFFWFLTLTLQGLSEPLWRTVRFVVTALAIRDVPYFSIPLDFSTRTMLYSSGVSLLEALLSLVAAYLLSLWLYGSGPLRSLSSCRAALTEAKHG